MTQLSGKDLDIAVGLANGWTIRPDEFNSGRWILPDGSQGMLVDVYRPSSLWMHGGPLIESVRISVEPHESIFGGRLEWYAERDGLSGIGSTALEAICRRVVMMKGQQ